MIIVLDNTLLIIMLSIIMLSTHFTVLYNDNNYYCGINTCIFRKLLLLHSHALHCDQN